MVVPQTLSGILCVLIDVRGVSGALSALRAGKVRTLRSSLSSASSVILEDKNGSDILNIALRKLMDYLIRNKYFFGRKSHRRYGSRCRTWFHKRMSSLTGDLQRLTIRCAAVIRRIPRAQSAEHSGRNIRNAQPVWYCILK